MELKTHCVITREVILMESDLNELMETRNNGLGPAQLRNMNLIYSAELVEWVDRLIEFSKGKPTE